MFLRLYSYNKCINSIKCPVKLDKKGLVKRGDVESSLPFLPINIRAVLRGDEQGPGLRPRAFCLNLGPRV